ncbi:hypothetical protein BsWGS_19703 [Bradybaena similaris]
MRTLQYKRRRGKAGRQLCRNPGRQSNKLARFSLVERLMCLLWRNIFPVVVARQVAHLRLSKAVHKNRQK